MSPVRLKARVGAPDIDHALSGAISLLEQRFPAQLRAHYLLGSWAYGDARPESDIDLVAVFRAGTDPEAGRQAPALVEEYGAAHGLDLGVFPLSDGQLPSLARVQLHSSRSTSTETTSGRSSSRPIPPLGLATRCTACSS